jgi:hypothetical protein
MIAKKKIGAGFRGALEYDLGKDGGQLLHKNLASTQPRAMAKEFAAIRRLRPNLKNAVLHVSISAAPGEKLSDAQWVEIGNKYLKGMGLENCQFVITRHTDTDHEHIHILANRIRFDGTVVSDSNDYKRQERLMRELEREYALAPVGASKDADHKAVKAGEIEKAMRLGERPPRLVLQQFVTAASAGRPTSIEFVRRLEAEGVGVVANIASTGKMNGFSFEFAGVAFSGSKLGEKYKWSELQKVIDYEQARDSEQLAKGRDAARRDTIAQPSRRLGKNSVDTVANDSETAAVDSEASGSDRGDRGRDCTGDSTARKPKHGSIIILESTGCDRNSVPEEAGQELQNARGPRELDRDIEKARRRAEADRKAAADRKIREAEIDHGNLQERRRRQLDAATWAPPQKMRIASCDNAPLHRSSYREQMLKKSYGQSSEQLAKYWRMEKPRPGQVVFSNSRGRVTDHGVSHQCHSGNDLEIAASIALAKMKGWKSISMPGSGHEDFRYRSMIAALENGLEIRALSAEDVAILERAKVAVAMKASADAMQPLRALADKVQALRPAPALSPSVRGVASARSTLARK